jgi:putative phage-type endonuclease
MSGDMRLSLPSSTLNEADRRALWLAERRTGVGGSDVPGITGASPWASPFSVWADKVGLAVDDSGTNDETQLGLDLEPVIAKWFERRNPGLHVVGQQSMVWHPTHKRHFATLDGWVVDFDPDVTPIRGITADGFVNPQPPKPIGVFESKKSAEEWETLPPHVSQQVMWQMWCSGMEQAWVAAMTFPYGHVKFNSYHVLRDDKRIAELVEQVDEFWTTYVVTGDMPPIDDTPATVRAITAAFGSDVTVDSPSVDFTGMRKVVDEFKRLRKDRAALKRELDGIESRLKAAFAKHPKLSEGTVDGKLAISWRSQERTDIDVAAVRADHGNRYDRVSTVRVLRPHDKD